MLHVNRTLRRVLLGMRVGFVRLHTRRNLNIFILHIYVQSVACALLDMSGSTLLSRLPASPYRSLNGLRHWVRLFRQGTLPPMALRYIVL